MRPAHGARTAAALLTGRRRGRCGRSAAAPSRWGRDRRRRSRARDRAGWTAIARAQRGRLHRGARAPACRSRTRRPRSPSTGQMLALDPPDPRRGDDRRRSSPPPTPGRCATATAACATSWSACTVVLSDGTVAKSGGKVIKNVAGLRPREAVRRLVRDARADRRRCPCACTRCPSATATAVAAQRRPGRAAGRGGSRSPRRPLEADCFDVALGRRPGRRIARCGCLARDGGARGDARRWRARDAGADEDDEDLGRQCARAAPRDGVVLKVSRPPDRPAGRDPRRGASGGTVVSRAALGLSWLALAGRRGRRRASATARAALAPCAVLDGADSAVRGA